VSSLYYELDTDMLLAGGYDGFIRQIETGNTDDGEDITWTAETKDYSHIDPESPGGVMDRKIFFGTKDDVEPDGGTITTTFNVDGTDSHTDLLTQSRRPSLNRLPDTAQGYRWRKRWTYTGTGTAKIYGTTTLAQPLKGA
jgi:hypothetical protein